MHNEAGWAGDRYCVYHDLGSWRGFMCAANFEELLVYYRPDGLPREQQPWLATVWRAVGWESVMKGIKATGDFEH